MTKNRHLTTMTRVNALLESWIRQTARAMAMGASPLAERIIQRPCCCLQLLAQRFLLLDRHGLEFGLEPFGHFLLLFDR